MERIYHAPLGSDEKQKSKAKCLIKLLAAYNAPALSRLNCWQRFVIEKFDRLPLNCTKSDFSRQCTARNPSEIWHHQLQHFTSVNFSISRSIYNRQWSHLEQGLPSWTNHCRLVSVAIPIDHQNEHHQFQLNGAHSMSCCIHPASRLIYVRNCDFTVDNLHAICLLSRLTFSSDHKHFYRHRPGFW